MILRAQDHPCGRRMTRVWADFRLGEGFGNLPGRKLSARFVSGVSELADDR